jgi:hypothetical protein
MQTLRNANISSNFKLDFLTDNNLNNRNYLKSKKIRETLKMQMEQKASESQSDFLKKFKESEFLTEKDKEDLIIEKMKQDERRKYLKQYSVSNKKVRFFLLQQFN